MRRLPRLLMLLSICLTSARTRSSPAFPAADLFGLVLGEVKEHRQQNVADQFVLRRKVRLDVASEAHAQMIRILRTHPFGILEAPHPTRVVVL